MPVSARQKISTVCIYDIIDAYTVEKRWKWRGHDFFQQFIFWIK